MLIPDIRRLHQEHGMLLLLMGKHDEAENIFDFICKKNKEQALPLCEMNWQPDYLNVSFIEALKGNYKVAVSNYIKCENSPEPLIANIAKHNIAALTSFLLINNISDPLTASYRYKIGH